MFRLYHQPARLLPVSTRLSVRLSTSRCTFLLLGFAHDCPRLYVRSSHELEEFAITIAR
nr:MAG TPA: hypothetical protein [Caudoviricetes sp.]